MLLLSTCPAVAEKDTHSLLWIGKDERKEKPRNMIRIFLKVNRWEVEARCRVLTAVT